MPQMSLLNKHISQLSYVRILNFFTSKKSISNRNCSTSTKLNSLSPTKRPRVPPIDETRSVNVTFGICVIEVYFNVLK